MGSLRAPNRTLLACLALVSLAACAGREAAVRPLWSQVDRVSPPLRVEDARLVLHTPDFARGRALLRLDKDLLRLSHEVNVIHLPAADYDFAIGILATGKSIGVSFPVELASAQTRYYRIDFPLPGENRVGIREYTRDEAVAGFSIPDPFIRSHATVTGAFRGALMRRDGPRE